MRACVRPAVFQQLELDYTLGAPHPRAGLTDLTEVPIVRMFGVTDAGNSVCLFVHGFEPYIYVEAPTRDFGPDDCESLRQHVNVRPAPRVWPRVHASFIPVERLKFQISLGAQSFVGQWMKQPMMKL